MDFINLNEEQKEALINCGAFDYPANKIANILDIDENYIKENLKNKTSEIYQLFKTGKDMFDYKIDVKLFELVQSGDLAALKELEKRKHAQKFPSI